MSRKDLRTPRGMRDFAPPEKRRREWVVGRIRTIFERYGYEPIETPSVELFDVLRGKLGEEGEQLLFKILRRGTELEDLRLGRIEKVTVTDFDAIVDSALRFDLTVPFSRFLAMHQDLPRPFKRYQIQPVWRAERQQRGRFREFYQCDVDIAGSELMLADAEIIAIVAETLVDLGFKDFETRIGHRKILSGLIEVAGGKEWAREIAVAIDKFDKIGDEGVRAEMADRAVPAEVIERIMELIAIKGTTAEILTQLEPKIGQTALGPEGIAETRELFELIDAMEIAVPYAKLDLRLVRGLDYYTGPVYESIVTEPAIGSLTGGGRYDQLIGKFSGIDLPATGTSIGLERIIEVMKEFEMFPADLGGTEILVAIFDETARNESLALARELRGVGLRTEIALRPPKGLKKQISYASAKGIPVIAVLGPDEIAAGEVTLRAGRDRQERVKRAEIGVEAQRFLAAQLGGD